MGDSPAPHIFGHEPFNMGYLIEYFAVDTLAACACLFYALNGYRVSLNQQWIGLIGAAIFNFYAFLHTVVAVINRRGVFTPEVKWGVTDRKAAFEELRSQLVPFFHHFAEHLRSEEANLNAVGRKYVPLELMKQISRQVWRIAPADRWEVIVPFVVNNLSRHMQRVRYLKVLTCSIPERAQQIGAMVYRNMDAVIWERLRTELRGIIPRGAPGWKRYY